jgi:hypothetical protein
MTETPLTDAEAWFANDHHETHEVVGADFAARFERVYHAAVAVLCNVDKMANDPRFDALRKACREVNKKENTNGQD